MNELIEQIENRNYKQAYDLLLECKAEIERLTLANETLKELNVEYLERVKLLETEAWRESKALEAKPVATVRIHKTGGNAGLAWYAEPVDGSPLMRDGTKLYTAPPNIEAKPVGYIKQISLDAITCGTFSAVSIRVSEKPDADSIVAIYTAPPNTETLISEAIESYINKTTLIKSVNLRTQAQPYLDELIAEIEAWYETNCSPSPRNLHEVLNKYRSKK